jgi:hypothetical protein
LDVATVGRTRARVQPVVPLFAAGLGDQQAAMASSTVKPRRIVATAPDRHGGEGENAKEGEQIIVVPDFVDVVPMANSEDPGLLAPDRKAFRVVRDAEEGPPQALAVGVEGAAPGWSCSNRVAAGAPEPGPFAPVGARSAGDRGGDARRGRKLAWSADASRKQRIGIGSHVLVTCSARPQRVGPERPGRRLSWL